MQATWVIRQQMITAYREPDRKIGGLDNQQLSHGVPNTLTEITTLGRTLMKRAATWGLLRPPRHQ